MILGRALTRQERLSSQRKFHLFSFVNGLSYTCLGENVLILFAAQLGAPNAVVSLLGAMIYVGFALLPLGVRRTAARGAAASQSDFWIARNTAALFTASAALVAPFSPQIAWTMVVFGAFVFYGCRAAGTVLSTPLIGDISTPEEAPGVFGANNALFNTSAVLMLSAITAATSHWHGPQVLPTIIVVGACFGFTSSQIMRGIRETGAIRDAARKPLRPGIRAAASRPDLRRLAVAWFLLNLTTMLVIPISMLSLKRGCGFGNSAALVCACAQFLASCPASFASGWACRRFGPRRVIVYASLGYLVVPVAWLFVPGSAGAAGLAAGCALFFWLGTANTMFGNSAGTYFLLACPDKADQVAGSVGINVIAAAAAGIFGSTAGAWLVTRVSAWAPLTGLSVFGGNVGPFRLYFLLVLPAAIAATVATLRLRTLVYSYREKHGEEALRHAIAAGHHSHGSRGARPHPVP